MGRKLGSKNKKTLAASAFPVKKAVKKAAVKTKSAKLESTKYSFEIVDTIPKNEFHGKRRDKEFSSSLRAHIKLLKVGQSFLVPVSAYTKSNSTFTILRRIANELNAGVKSGQEVFIVSRKAVNADKVELGIRVKRESAAIK